MLMLLLLLVLICERVRALYGKSFEGPFLFSFLSFRMLDMNILVYMVGIYVGSTIGVFGLIHIWE